MTGAVLTGDAYRLLAYYSCGRRNSQRHSQRYRRVVNKFSAAMLVSTVNAAFQKCFRRIERRISNRRTPHNTYVLNAFRSLAAT